MNFFNKFLFLVKHARLKARLEEGKVYPWIEKNTLLLCTFLYTLSMVEFDGWPQSILSTWINFFLLLTQMKKTPIQSCYLHQTPSILLRMNCCQKLINVFLHIKNILALSCQNLKPILNYVLKKNNVTLALYVTSLMINP